MPTLRADPQCLWPKPLCPKADSVIVRGAPALCQKCAEHQGWFFFVLFCFFNPPNNSMSGIVLSLGNEAQ